MLRSAVVSSATAAPIRLHPGRVADRQQRPKAPPPPRPRPRSAGRQPVQQAPRSPPATHRPSRRTAGCSTGRGGCSVPSPASVRDSNILELLSVGGRMAPRAAGRSPRPVLVEGVEARSDARAAQAFSAEAPKDRSLIGDIRMFERELADAVTAARFDVAADGGRRRPRSPGPSHRWPGSAAARPRRRRRPGPALPCSHQPAIGRVVGRVPRIAQVGQAGVVQAAGQVAHKIAAIGEASNLVEEAPAQLDEVNHRVGQEQRFAAAGDDQPTWRRVRGQRR